MYKRKAMVINVTGLHARPASVFVNTAKKFKSAVSIRHIGEENEFINAKSVIMLLSLGIGQGEEIEIAADGTDEKMAVDSLIELIQGGFGEA